jgi:TLC domain
VLHHFLTFSLILFSYNLNYLPVGAAVMVLHDVTDLGVSIFKLTIDVTPTAIQIIGYFIMFFTWVYFRLWFFPLHVIGRIVEESLQWHGSLRYDLNSVAMLTCFLSVLFLMHVFWFYLMIKGVMKRFKTANWKEAVSLQSSENRAD